MSPIVLTDPWERLRRLTPARIALGRTGDSLPTEALLDFGVAHAAARDAVHRELDVTVLKERLVALERPIVEVESAATDRPTYLRRPDFGRRLSEASRTLLEQRNSLGFPGIVFVLSDGLSALAIERHALPLLEEALPRVADFSVAPLVIARQARVALGDEIGALWHARFVVVLIGERPGLSSPDSLGIYLTYEPHVGRQDAERNCISNVRPQGLSYAHAARKLEFLLRAGQHLGATGVVLKDESDSIGELPGDGRALSHPLPLPRLLDEALPVRDATKESEA